MQVNAGGAGRADAGGMDTPRTAESPRPAPRLPLDMGPLRALLDDPDVTEIMVNGAHRIFAERHGRKQPTGLQFQNEAALRTCIERVFVAHGKRLAPEQPFGDVCLADGTRINAILPPLARFGLAVTLRKFSRNIRSLGDLVRLGAVTAPVAELLVACIKGKVNILFSGGTSSGKTTLLQVLSEHFDPRERVITVEDAAELQFAQDNVISLETRAGDEAGRGEVTLRHLVRNALRMAPDRIVVGEVRGAEALDMVQAMATGHAGTLGVIHGSSPAEALMRLETMILMAGLSLPLGEVRRMIASTVQLVVHLDRRPEGRQVTAVAEVRGVTGDNDQLILSELFVRPPGAPALEPVMHYYPRFYQRLKDRGLLGADALQAAADAPGGVAQIR